MTSFAHGVNETVLKTVKIEKNNTSYDQQSYEINALNCFVSES